MIAAARPRAVEASSGAPDVTALDAVVLDYSRGVRAALGVSAAEWLALLVIVTAAVHPYARAPQSDPRYGDGRPLPPHLAGRTSRRRVADVTGLPLETVRRIVARLAAAGLTREDATGLHGPSGLHLRVADAGLLESGARAFGAAVGVDPADAAARLRADPRVTSYALGNIGLQLQLSLGRQYALPPATLELFLRLLLKPPAAASERDAAHALALPRETMRRRLARLAARGLVVPSLGLPRVPGAVRAGHVAHPEADERLRLAGQLRRALELSDPAGATRG